MSDLNKILLNKKRRKKNTATKSEEDPIDLNLKEGANPNKHSSNLVKIDFNGDNNFIKINVKLRKNKRKIILSKAKKIQISKKKKDITSNKFLNSNEETIQPALVPLNELENKEILVTNYINSSDLEQHTDTNLACDIVIDSPKLSEMKAEIIFDENKMKNFISIVEKQEEVTIIAGYEKEIKVCSICWENVNFTEKHHLRCGHVFHKLCIGEWFKSKNTCPNCKQSNYEISLNLLNENFSLFSEADFNDVIFSDDLREARILRNYNEESLSFVNDVNLFLEVADRHRFLLIFIFYVFFFISFKIVLMMKSFL